LAEKNSRQMAFDLSELVRYRDPKTGKTWCGYGRPPDWIRGRKRERFRVS
jgi:DNA-binding protein H-NS